MKSCKPKVENAIKRITEMESILDEALRRMDDAEEAPQYLYVCCLVFLHQNITRRFRRKKRRNDNE